jgi:hypothetical protein
MKPILRVTSLGQTNLRCAACHRKVTGTVAVSAFPNKLYELPCGCCALWGPDPEFGALDAPTLALALLMLEEA